MKNKMVTLAIHTLGKALILRQVLEENRIEVFFSEINRERPHTSDNKGIRVLINESDIPQALQIIEEKGLFNYNDQQSYKTDDGRKRILVAVDFSEYSLKACRVAFRIADILDAKVKILHVYTNARFSSTFPFADTSNATKDDTILNRTRKQMLKLCLEIDEYISNGEFPSVNYSYSLREGMAVEESVNDFVIEYRPFLLVLGTKGKDNDKARMLGNITADIIEMTDVPVLAVPENMDIEESNLKHIAFLTNFPERDMASFITLSAILKLGLNIKITLLHINIINKKGEKWSDNDLLEMKDDFLKQCDWVNVEYKLIDAPDMLKAIIDFVNQEHVNIIALNTRKRNLLGRMFTPSVSRKIMLKSDVALLVLRS